MNNLYREEILEHYRSPQNFGFIENFSIKSKQTNPFCGDEIEIFINWKSTNKYKKKQISVGEISFNGYGCAISIASASILTEYSKGKAINELTKFSQKDMLRLLGVEVSEARKKCALLALGVLRDCLYAT